MSKRNCYPRFIWRIPDELLALQLPNIFNVLSPCVVRITLLCLPLYSTSTNGMSNPPAMLIGFSKPLSLLSLATLKPLSCFACFRLSLYYAWLRNYWDLTLKLYQNNDLHHRIFLIFQDIRLLIHGALSLGLLSMAAS
jgi:hypothetical protein